jgi:hypothetical protein
MTEQSIIESQQKLLMALKTAGATDMQSLVQIHEIMLTAILNLVAPVDSEARKVYNTALLSIMDTATAEFVRPKIMHG